MGITTNKIHKVLTKLIFIQKAMIMHKTRKQFTVNTNPQNVMFDKLVLILIKERKYLPNAANKIAEKAMGRAGDLAGSSGGKQFVIMSYNL